MSGIGLIKITLRNGGAQKRSQFWKGFHIFKFKLNLIFLHMSFGTKVYRNKHEAKNKFHMIIHIFNSIILKSYIIENAITIGHKLPKNNTF